MYYDNDPEVHRSALIHGITGADALTAEQHRVMTMDIDKSESGRELVLGFDSRGRLLELVVMTLGDGRRFIIHSMKARKVYRDLIPKGRGQ